MADVSPSVAACMSDMASEILTLRARLAEVEAERDPVGAWLRMKARACAAEARLAAVEAELDAARADVNVLLSQPIERNYLIRAEAAEARLAAVEALCDEWSKDRPGEIGSPAHAASEIRAVARGEGDRG